MSEAAPAALRVSYGQPERQAVGDTAGLLGVFSFGEAAPSVTGALSVRVPLPILVGGPLRECWRVAAPVVGGVDGEVRWAAGGGWRLSVIEVDAAPAGGIETASEHAYRLLLAHVALAPERHLQRIWNYLGGINDGQGDQERYRLFCNGRARGMQACGLQHYPAATAIGHRDHACGLQVYALSSGWPGQAIENPRQVSAWHYPREYGPTAPNFARAMRLPGGPLAISGTAAVIGSASHHAGDVAAQADEAFANLAALLERAALPAFDAYSPLKVYVRRPDDVAVVRAALACHLDPAVPRVLLNGDICRHELLVEVDGWRFTPGA